MSAPNHDIEPTAAFTPLLVGRADAAAMVAVSVATWDRMVSAGKTPAPVRPCGRPLWRIADLESWVGLGCPNRMTFENVCVSKENMQ